MNRVVSTRISDKLFKKAEYYARTRGFANIADLLRDALREKVEHQ